MTICVPYRDDAGAVVAASESWLDALREEANQEPAGDAGPCSGCAQPAGAMLCVRCRAAWCAPGQGSCNTIPEVYFLPLHGAHTLLCPDCAQAVSRADADRARPLNPPGQDTPAANVMDRLSVSPTAYPLVSTSMVAVPVTR